ncbi:hypothetical protein [Paenibacillus agricola]|uniref:Uncharacterized protein n=1 Tax=Paenibacillus agricola TaxID=2716264 RepID=A0ABX0J9U3_9BACL|nr:hypothetical protein [Paenibacillus agricola]NHN33200.1 hypothetical protein [Paenibacillus agricola]
MKPFFRKHKEEPKNEVRIRVLDPDKDIISSTTDLDVNIFQIVNESFDTIEKQQQLINKLQKVGCYLEIWIETNKATKTQNGLSVRPLFVIVSKENSELVKHATENFGYILEIIAQKTGSESTIKSV